MRDTLQQTESVVKFKPLQYLFLAAISLVLTGLILNPDKNIVDWFYLIWVTTTGIFITYRFNDSVDQSDGFRFNFKDFFSNKLNAFIILQFILIMLPISYYYLSEFRFYLLGVMFFLGMLYSVNIDYKNIKFRLKHIFLVKNILIGLCWGGLVLIGSNNINENSTIALTFIAIIQVFIGSSIRDLNDIEQDTIEYVRSIPIVLGVNNTFILFHLLNTLCLIFGLLYLEDSSFYLGISIIFIWRLFVLFKIQKDIHHLFWTQKMNLLTCSIIFLGTLISWIL